MGLSSTVDMDLAVGRRQDVTTPARGVDLRPPRLTGARMDYQRFLAIVEGAAAIPRESAERAVRATLQTLAERIAGGEARDLAEQLPPELAPWLATTSGAERFDVDAFLRRVAGREGTDVATAERHVRAV